MDRRPAWANRLYRFHGRTPPDPARRTPVRAATPTVTRADDGAHVLRLYDPIDDWGEIWGVSASEFAEALDSIPSAAQEIRLHINSPGGIVTEGIAILNLLRNHPARVVAVVDGLAASAASFIAAGADEVVMGRNTEMMIHDAWGLCVGNAEDMRDLAGRLDHLSDNIASIYAAKAGGTLEEWRSAMQAETWYSAEEAVAAGLADRVDAGADGGDARNAFDLEQFTYPGRAAAPAPPAHTSTPSSTSVADAAASAQGAAEDLTPPAPTPPPAGSGDTSTTIDPARAGRLAELLTATRHTERG